MDNNDIRKHLEELKKFESLLKDGSDDSDVEVFEELDNLIQKLGDDLKTSYSKPKLQVKVKKLSPNAVIPKYAKNGDAGMDLTAIEVGFTDDYVSYKTGLAFEIPEGYVGLLFPRSSNSKKDLLLTNSVGVIDSGYRGEIEFRFKPILNGKTENILLYNVGDRVGQIMILPYPEIEFIESQELSSTERGDGGFGSTNN